MQKEIKGKIKIVRADGAYYTEEVYPIIEDWGAQAMIPPARTSKAQEELKRKPYKKKIHLQRHHQLIIMESAKGPRRFKWAILVQGALFTDYKSV